MRAVCAGPTTPVPFPPFPFFPKKAATSRAAFFMFGVNPFACVQNNSHSVTNRIRAMPTRVRLCRQGADSGAIWANQLLDSRFWE